MKFSAALVPLAFAALTGCATPETLAFHLNDQGNQAYQAGRYEEALGFYRQAQVARPDFPELNVNAGSALHKHKDYDRAARELQRALSSEANRLRSDAHYALGNNLYRMGRMTEAVEEYKWALRYLSDDTDAKHNLEFVLLQIGDRPQPPEQQPSNAPSQGQNQGKPQDNNEDQNQQGQQGQNGQNGQQGASPGQSPSAGSPSQGQQSREQPDNSGLNQALEQAGSDFGIDDAYKILDALRERERAIQGQWNRGGGKVPATDRDW